MPSISTQVDFAYLSPHSIVHNFRKDAVPDGEERGAAAVVAAGPSEGEVRRVGRHGTEFVGFKHKQG